MRSILAGAGIVLLVAAVMVARPEPFGNFDNKVCDLLTGAVSRGKPSGQIAIVEIDEASLAQFGRWPWPRDLLGRLVTRVLEQHAAVAVLDVMLHDEDRAAPSNPACGAHTNDEAFACAISGKPVVLGYAFQFDRIPGGAPACAIQSSSLTVVGPSDAWETAFFHPARALCTVPSIAAAAAAGFLNAAPDSDGKLRRVPVVMEYAGQQLPSLALAAYQAYRGTAPMQLRLGSRDAAELRVGAGTVPAEGRSLLRLRFRGPRRTFPYVSAASLLSSSGASAMLEGKIAIIGGSAVGLPNPLATPLEALFPDVEVQATAIDNLIQGDVFHRPAAFLAWESVLAIGAGMIAAILLARIRSWWSAWAVVGITVATWAGCALLLAATGVLLSPLAATATVGCCFPLITFLNYRQEKSKAEKTGLELAAVQRESESRYERLVENVNDAIIVNDAEGRLVFANRRFRGWFELEGKDIRDVSLEDYIAPEWRASVRDQHGRLMRGEAVPGNTEYEAIRPDGSRIWIEALVTSVGDDGRVTGTQAALRDITQRKRMEAQYLQAQKMESLGRLAGVVAHDFNNLLTVINGYCDLLLRGRQPANQLTRDLQEIRSAGERATELTRNLLAFSRKQLTEPRPLDLNTLVRDGEKMFDRLVGEDIQLVTRLGSDLGLVMADPGQWHQVLMNLMVNARDAMPRGGTITVETKNVGANQVYLGVTDTGLGMSDDVKSHIFEPFYTTKEPGKGTGLGLATILGIVQGSGGRIEVTSRPGNGTSFHIYLPRLAAGHFVPVRETEAKAGQQGSGTVLVVEDQDGVRRLIRDVLEEAGYRVLLAANGQDALALAGKYPDQIHLLVTDLVMPLMNGWDMAGKLEAARPGIKVMFMSGYTEETMSSRGIAPKGAGYLSKPFSPAALTAKVREVLSASETAGQDANGLAQ